MPEFDILQGSNEGNRAAPETSPEEFDKDDWSDLFGLDYGSMDD